MMFKKLVAVEPVNLTRKAQKELEQYAEKVLFYEDIPKNEEEIIKRIGDADGVLVSYTSPIGRNVLESCPNVRYVDTCVRRTTWSSRPTMTTTSCAAARIPSISRLASSPTTAISTTRSRPGLSRRSIPHRSATSSCAICRTTTIVRYWPCRLLPRRSRRSE